MDQFDDKLKQVATISALTFPISEEARKLLSKRMIVPLTVKVSKSGPFLELDFSQKPETVGSLLTTEELIELGYLKGKKLSLLTF